MTTTAVATARVAAPVESRVVGVDVARCLALVGMIATHLLPGVVDGEVQLAHQVAGGRASALFAVLAGVSLVLASGTRAPLRGRAWCGLLAGTAVRAALVGALGLVLGGLDTGIAIILVYYAVLFLLVVPFMALSTGPLVAVTAGWVVVAPVVSHLLRSQLPPPSYDVPSLTSLAGLGELVRGLLLTGYYPALTWLPYLLLGILVARLDLRQAGTPGVLAAGGALAVAAGWSWSTVLLAQSGVRAELVRTFQGASWRNDLDTTLGHGLHGTTPTGSLWWLAVHGPHTGTTFDLLMTGGSACLVLGGCLVVGRAMPRLASVVFGAGAMTLTLYTLHVLLLRPDGFGDGHDTATFLWHATLVLTIGALVRGLGHRGPLEIAVGRATTAAREAVTGRR